MYMSQTAESLRHVVLFKNDYNIRLAFFKISFFEIVHFDNRSGELKIFR